VVVFDVKECKLNVEVSQVNHGFLHGFGLDIPHGLEGMHDNANGISLSPV